MRAGKFLCIGWLPILLCSLALLALTLAFKWRHIEGELKQSTTTSLAGEQHAWAKVETYNLGRDVLLVGSPPNKAALDDALTLAGDTYGVRSASHNGDAFAEQAVVQVEEPAPTPAPVLNAAELKASLDNNVLELSGALSSQAEVDRVYAEAVQAYPNANVINNLTVADNTAALGDSLLVSALKGEAQNNTPMTVHLKNGVLRLIGTVESENAKSVAESNARQYFTGSISNELIVAKPIIKKDICQDTINGLMASATINFDTGKAIISASSTSLLDTIVDTAKNCPDANFEVGGHTDSTGNLSSNMALSQKRAQAVVDYLVNEGLTGDRFIARGFGPQQPIADNSTSQGRAQNRRIEFKLSN